MLKGADDIWSENGFCARTTGQRSWHYNGGSPPLRANHDIVVSHWKHVPVLVIVRSVGVIEYAERGGGCRDPPKKLTIQFC